MSRLALRLSLSASGSRSNSFSKNSARQKCHQDEDFSVAEQIADERVRDIAVRLAVYQYMNSHRKLDDIIDHFKDEILAFTVDEINRYVRNRAMTE